MLLSNSCAYGLRATIYLAGSNEGAYLPIKTISKELGISYYYLPKIFQNLSRAGLIKSFKGPNGGVKLASPPDQISIQDIVFAIDGPDLFSECVLGLPGCGELKPCPLHEKWTEERIRLNQLFGQTSLADMAKKINTSHGRLSVLKAVSTTR